MRGMAKAMSCILVVEDDRAVRDLLVAFLKAGGYDKVVTAGNAEEAYFYIFKDRGLDIHLVLLDLVLPNASGLALIRRVRASKFPRRRATPIVVLTGRTDTGTYKAASRRGIQGYLMKPLSAGLLLDTVHNVLAAAGSPLATLGHKPAGEPQETEAEPPPPAQLIEEPAKTAD